MARKRKHPLILKTNAELLVGILSVPALGLTWCMSPYTWPHVYLPRVHADLSTNARADLGARVILDACMHNARAVP
jgi:hypothetical protein